jgi:hypothetical protein
MSVHAFPNHYIKFYFPECLALGSLTPTGLLATPLRFCFPFIALFAFHQFLWNTGTLEHFNPSARRDSEEDTKLI